MPASYILATIGMGLIGGMLLVLTGWLPGSDSLVIQAIVLGSRNVVGCFLFVFAGTVIAPCRKHEVGLAYSYILLITSVLCMIRYPYAKDPFYHVVLIVSVLICAILFIAGFRFKCIGWLPSDDVVFQNIVSRILRESSQLNVIVSTYHGTPSDLEQLGQELLDRGVKLEQARSALANPHLIYYFYKHSTRINDGRSYDGDSWITLVNWAKQSPVAEDPPI